MGKDRTPIVLLDAIKLEGRRDKIMFRQIPETWIAGKVVLQKRTEIGIAVLRAKQVEMRRRV